MLHTTPLHVSVGVFAYNEEKNIEKALESLLKQKLQQVVIEEILVVSSGSYDLTNKLIKRMARLDKRITLVEEIRRKGKSSAINRFLRLAKFPIVVTMSADLRLHPQAIEEVVLPFRHQAVGMVGAHPKPANARYSSIGREIELLWQLHHLISLIKPKCGELVAFRNIIHEIPRHSAVDEATIEVLLQLIGYKTVYAPRSIVYNKGPKNVSSYLKQRRRVYNGHQWVKSRYNYNVVTLDVNQIVRVVLVEMVEKPEQIPVMIRLISLELAARMLGWLDYHFLKRNPFKWDMIER